MVGEFRKPQELSDRLGRLGDFVDDDAAPFFFLGGVVLVDTAGEVEGFAVGGEGGGGDAEADVLVVES